MMRLARSIRLLVPLGLLAACAACSTAKPGSTAGESASTIGATPRAPLVRPESLPQAEPTLEQPMPAAPALSRDTATGERATIARLEREARAIARATGCASARACRSAGVGVKACGGPRTYVVYCAATTDTVALARKLRELDRVERAYNEHSGMMSTCEMRLPPNVTLMGGTCGAQQGAGVERVP